MYQIFKITSVGQTRTRNELHENSNHAPQNDKTHHSNRPLYNELNQTRKLHELTRQLLHVT